MVGSFTLKYHILTPLINVSNYQPLTIIYKLIHNVQDGFLRNSVAKLLCNLLTKQLYRGVNAHYKVISQVAQIIMIMKW